MAKKKFRKPTPQPPHWFWPDSDNCWDCNKNYNGCRNCKRLKEIKHTEINKRINKDKNNLKNYID